MNWHFFVISTRTHTSLCLIASKLPSETKPDIPSPSPLIWNTLLTEVQTASQLWFIMYCCPLRVIQYFLIVYCVICFSLATPTSTLLLRNLIPLSAQSRSPRRWNLNILFSLAGAHGGGDGGVERQAAWHHHPSPSFQHFSLSLSLFFLFLLLLSPDRGAFWPVYFLFFRKDWAFCYFLFLPLSCSNLSSLPLQVSPAGNSLLNVRHAPAFFYHLFGACSHLLLSLSVGHDRVDSRYDKFDAISII